MIKKTAFWVLALAILGAAPTPAQYEDEDEKLKDEAERDRLYLERYQKQESPDTGLSAEEAEAAIFARIEELIRDRNYNGATSDHFRVQTDDPRLDPQAATELLESFRSYFESFWADRLPLKPYEKTGRVFLFYSFFKYNQLLEGDFRFSAQRPKGHYGSLFDGITLHTDADGPGDLADTLVHEATHQMMDQRLNLTVGGTLPWLSEGMAHYFGNMQRDKSGKFLGAVVGGKGIGLFRDGKIYDSRLPALGLRNFRRSAKNVGSGDSLFGTLLGIRDPNVFYGGNAELNYNASWMLVHYLFHGAEGAHADAFVRYLEQESQGKGGPDVLMKEIGLTYQALDAEVARHATTVKVR
jgi:hypothetical protein